MDQERETSYVAFGTHMHLLHCDFILQRTLVKHKGGGSETLLSIAHEMLSVLLIATSYWSRDGHDNNILAWTVYYSLSCTFLPCIAYRN